MNKLITLIKKDTWVFPYLKSYKKLLVLILFLGFMTIFCGAALMFTSGFLISRSAQIPENGSANTSIAVQDRELYEANKAECRKDIEEFNKLVYAMEDKRVTETKGVNEDEAEE